MSTIDERDLQAVMDLLSAYGSGWAAHTRNDNSIMVRDEEDRYVVSGRLNYVLEVTERSLVYHGFMKVPVNPDGDALDRLVRQI